MCKRNGNLKSQVNLYVYHVAKLLWKEFKDRIRESTCMSKICFAHMKELNQKLWKLDGAMILKRLDLKSRRKSRIKRVYC